MLGMIVNTLVLRTRVSGQMSFADLLDQVQQTVVDALAWPDTPVDAVIDAIGPARDASRTPLFQVIFTFHDSIVPDLDFGGLTGVVTERENGSAKCDLTVIVVPRAAQRLGREPRPEDDDLTLVWEHSTDLFDEPTMSRMVTHYLNLLTERPGHAGRIDAWMLIGAESLHLILGRLREWLGPTAEPIAGQAAAVAPGGPHRPGYPADATIPALFAAQVAREPGRGGAGLRQHRGHLRRARPAQQCAGLAAAPPRREHGHAGRGGDGARPRPHRRAAGRAQSRRRLPADRSRQPTAPRRRHDRCRGRPARAGRPAPPPPR